MLSFILQQALSANAHKCYSVNNDSGLKVMILVILCEFPHIKGGLQQQAQP
jgi:hypothetical protein